jgi:putative peptide zinc metalloprotease protein
MGGESNLHTLNPMVRLYPSRPDHHGQPQWVLYHPVSNKYFKIGWPEFEIISRLHKHKSADALLTDITQNTHINITSEDIENIIIFLYKNGMINGSDDPILDTEKEPWWKKLIHGYLYFTMPLFKPQTFLNNTIHIVRPLLGRTFATIMLFILCGAIMATLPRMDEFFNSFIQIFTLEGIILTTCVYTIIKIFHELAHAYTATKYGVPVPHMGVAFIILYPIFYTEATGTWRITDKKARMNIGLAGVLVELYIAAIALIAWHFMEPGLGQMIAFSTVAISLLGSIFINLNPLMRFDGYYVLSDSTEIENLHSTAIDYARHWMRKIILGLYDDKPHDYPSKTVRFLTIFGMAVIVYRFFLFLGIAVLVYAMFFKPLGLFLMLFELVWFIGLPIWKELKIWFERYQDYKANRQFKLSIFVFLLTIIITLIPFKQTLNIPAVSHTENYQVIYTSEAAEIEKIYVKNGAIVEQGSLLISLRSDKLSHDLKLARQRLNHLKKVRQRERLNFDSFRQNITLTDEEIKTAQIEYDALLEKTEKLKIKAQFDGVISDMDSDLRQGQAVNPSRALLRVITPNNNTITAYIRESNLDRINVGSIGTFRPNHALSGTIDVKISAIEDVNIETLPYASLTSPHQGPIPAQANQDGIKPLISLYKIKFEVLDSEKDSLPDYTIPGYVIVGDKNTAIVARFITKITQTIRNELSFN